MITEEETRIHNSNKRHCSVFERLVQWIVSHKGGYVHPNISLVGDGDDNYDDNPHRYLRVVQSNSEVKEEKGKETSQDNNPVVIGKGEVVFCIPHSVLITSSNITPRPQNDRGTTTFLCSSSSLPTLHLPQSDVQLALYLASQPTKIRPYLDSLPIKCDAALPRRWSSTELTYLRGSPLLATIQKQRQGVQNDYDALSLAAQSHDDDSLNEHHMPSFEEFSHYVAVVTSRAFEGFTNDQGPSCLIPLLDLCNHGRGLTTAKSNVSYRWDEHQQVVVVEAKIDLYANNALIITYGAQGNSALLMNYGFCISHNLEPDGSSNDVYELRVGTSTTGVTLRAGPKSYSYGGLVQALDACRVSLPASHGERGVDSGDSVVAGEARRRPDPDDIDAFLNECDEQDDHDEQQDESNSSSCDTEVDDDPDDNMATILTELKSLSALHSCLERARSGYTVSEDVLVRVLNRDSSSGSRESLVDDKRYHAALLIQSELRTLYFFELAVHQIRRTLSEALLVEAGNGIRDGSSNGMRNYSAPPVPPLWLTDSDAELIRSQVEELVQVFFKIRHSNLHVAK